MDRYLVKARNLRYHVVIGRGAWAALREFRNAGYSSIFLISEKPLWAKWGKTFLRQSGLKVKRILFIPPGEKSKSMRMVEQAAAQLLKLGADRRSMLIAFGGGVVGDLGGFVAATYMRGIDFIQAPTTVVGQVDSAIGGKTGVNLGAMKNLVGAFYPPRMVVAEPRVLGTMSPRAFRSGLYEVAKHGILEGNPLFDELEVTMAELHPQNMGILEPILSAAAKVKVNVVNRDEREAKARLVLNLGHTFGHALEEVTVYRRFTHGEAVGWGLLAVIRLAARLKLLNPHPAERMTELILRVGPLPSVHDIPAKRVLGLLSQDKKAIGGRIQWVIPTGIGSVQIVCGVSSDVAAKAFDDIQDLDRNLRQSS